MRDAWFCPSCKRHHAPHVETCPGGVAEVHPFDTHGPIGPYRPWGIPYSPHDHGTLNPSDMCKACDELGFCGNSACPRRMVSVNTTSIGAH